MWVDDGYGITYDTLPPVWYFYQQGIECSDLINYTLIDNGLNPIYGTEAAVNYLLNQQTFNPNTPGQAGAVAYQPYTSDVIGYQGHIALYWDDYYLIQALNGNPPYYGVTYNYTDNETHWWGADTRFTTYAFLPGVSY